MPIATAGDLIALALKTSGILGQGQSAAAEDSSDALNLLNMIIEQWQRRRWLVWSLTETAIVATGAASYTVGRGFDFDIARPDKIESAFARMLQAGISIPGAVINGGVLTIPLGSNLPTSPVGLAAGSYWNNGGVVCVVSGLLPGAAPGALFVDLPLAIVEAREDYNAISLKSLTTVPGAVFYESSFPVGVLHFWPIPPAASYELHIATKAQLPYYNDLFSALNLPPEYTEAALYSLAVRLSMGYGQQPNPGHVAAMRAALSTIRTANAQIGTLGMPAGLAGRRRGGIAANSDPRFQSGWW